jgi:CDP-6-deoxy-D-xylo-4-hexulose-3-dehydrase
VPGETVVPYAGRVFTEDEVEAAVGSTLDFWLTLGPEGEAFEKELAAFLGVKYSLLVNSGSSANLVALSALTTHKLPEHKRIKQGDEVITVAAGFPTTVAPILQNGAVPVFVDNDPATGNIRADQLEAAFSPGKTKAVMIAHALGNPFDVALVLEFCRKHDLWLIEDNCDALGCTYSMPLEFAKKLGLDHLIKLAEANALKVEVESSSSSADSKHSESINSLAGSSTSTANFNWPKIPFIKNGVLTAYTGTFGDISTQSFYPPHHLTMGEGGAVNIVSRPPLKTYAESFRDWGRDCWCPSGKDDTCGKRFGWNLGELPPGYDHKYTYSHLGYNLKPLDPQAAIGREQLKKLPAFIEARARNWEYLRAGLADLEDVFDFSLPTHGTAWHPPSGVKGKSLSESTDSGSSTSALQLSTFDWDSSGCSTGCSWFGFMLRVKPSAPFTHTDLARHLDEKKIGNRMFFGGNLLRQPVFVQLRKDRPEAFRVISATGKALTASELELQLSTSTAANGAASPLPGADAIMNQALFLGTYPGLTREMMDYEIETIGSFVRSF